MTVLYVPYSLGEGVGVRTADADNDDRAAANVLVVLDDAHALEGHQPRVGVVVPHLTPRKLLM